MRLERSHFLWKNAIQGEKLTVEEMDYKIDKKEVEIEFKEIRKANILFEFYDF